MINTVLNTPWGLMRWLRLVIGGYMIFVGFSEFDVFTGSVGFIFLLLALFNRGCAGGTCSPPKSK